MAKKIQRPTFIQITHTISHSACLESNTDFDSIWIDELAFCLRWINGALHHIDLKTVDFPNENTYAMHLFLRFDSGATAGIYVNAAATESRHVRVAANNNFILECDVLEQTVNLSEQNEGGNLFHKRQTFDVTKSAELAAMEFIK